MVRMENEVSPAEKSYTFKQKAVLAAVPPVAATLFKGICATCRLEVRNREHLDAVLEAKGRSILAIWHETLGIALWYYRNSGYTTLTSQSYDGELAARVVQCFGLNTARGSSTRGGFAALGDLRKALRRPPGIGLTVDGPRGPRRVAKPGVAILSAVSGIPITTTVFVARPAKRLHSWDRFVVPRPFGRIVCAFGPPIPPPPDHSAEAIEATRMQVERVMNELHEELGDPM